MEPETSVMLQSSDDESMLIRTAADIVNDRDQNEDEDEEQEYFVLTAEDQEEQDRQMEIIAEGTTIVDNDDIQDNRLWSKMCRICANSSNHLISIFMGEGAEHKLCEKIHKYLPIRVSADDNLPLKLCYHCAATLLAWHDLVDGCLAAEQSLLRLQSELRQKTQTATIQEVAKDGQEATKADQTDPVNEVILMPQGQASCVRGEGLEDAVLGDPERSSRGQTPFKVFLETHNVFWKPYKRPNDRTSETKTLEIDNSIWIASTDATTHPEQTSMTPEHPPKNSDTKVKRECHDEFLEVSIKEYERSSDGEDASERTAFRCKVCSDEFRSVKKLQNHGKTHHRGAQSSAQETFRCYECGKCFKLKDSYFRHMRIHTDERPFTCHVCGKRFRDSGGLSRHLKDVHAKLKNFSCDICSKCFASKATRDDHRRTHTGERPFICDSCGKTFKSKASLYIHSKLHTNEFPYPCTYCKKKFRRRQEMLAHVTTHTGEKNFACDVCAKRFRVKSELVRHRLVHSEDKPFVCTKCGFAFRQKRYLNNHVKSRHVNP